MWGKVAKMILLKMVFGITPTHVGKSRRTIPDDCPDWDHPHPCGEKNSTFLLPRFALGSPPPMWGKGIAKITISAGEGITPTHVGKSETVPSPLLAARDHPHPCGEKLTMYNHNCRAIGSPPPMWGKDYWTIDSVNWEGITPTHVGKSYKTMLAIMAM